MTIRAVRDGDGNTFEIEGKGPDVLVRFYGSNSDDLPEPVSRLTPDQAKWLARELSHMASQEARMARSSG
jgi:hypothetical protein